MARRRRELFYAFTLAAEGADNTSFEGGNKSSAPPMRLLDSQHAHARKNAFWSAGIPRLRDRFQSADMSARSKFQRRRLRLRLNCYET